MTETLEDRRAPHRATSSAASGARASPARPTRSATRGGPSEVDRRLSRIGRGRTRAPPSTPRETRSPAGQRCRPRSAAAFFFKAADALEARVEQIAQDMTREMGKPLREARGGGADGADPPLLRRARRTGRVARSTSRRSTGSASTRVRRPLGVVGLITPWNFPAAIPVWKLAPALVYGNTVVLKLAHEAPRTGPAHRRVLRRGGASRRGPERASSGAARRSGRARRAIPGVRAISFTGSVAVGDQVRDEATAPATARPARARRPQPADRDGRRRARPRRRGRLRGRVLVGGAEVHGDAAHLRPGRRSTTTSAPRLLARIDARRRSGDPGRSGDRGRPDRQRARARRRARRRSSAAAPKAARCSPAASACDDEAYLVAPTLFEGVADDAFLSCEEVFGPVTSLYRFSTLDEAIARANAVEFGLSAAIFTRDLHDGAALRDEARGGDPARQLADGRRRRPRPVRRDQGLRLGPARAGPRRDRVLHRGRHRLPGR